MITEKNSGYDENMHYELIGADEATKTCLNEAKYPN